MKAVLWGVLVISATLGGARPAAGQVPVGALAINERQGRQYGWAVDYETAAAAQAAALEACGAGCSVVLIFDRCGAYAADQDSDSTAVGWAEAYNSAASAQQAALAECHARGGGSGCIVRAWGCNDPVVEDGLGLDPASRRQIQLSLGAAGYDPGGADGLFGPRTRAAIRGWQRSRGARATGYLDGAEAEALRTPGASKPAAAETAQPVPSVATVTQPQTPSAGAASPPAPAAPELSAGARATEPAGPDVSEAAPTGFCDLPVEDPIIGIVRYQRGLDSIGAGPRVEHCSPSNVFQVCRDRTYSSSLDADMQLDARRFRFLDEGGPYCTISHRRGAVGPETITPYRVEIYRLGSDIKVPDPPAFGRRTGHACSMPWRSGSAYPSMRTSADKELRKSEPSRRARGDRPK